MHTACRHSTARKKTGLLPPSLVPFDQKRLPFAGCCILCRGHLLSSWPPHVNRWHQCDAVEDLQDPSSGFKGECRRCCVELRFLLLPRSFELPRNPCQVHRLPTPMASSHNLYGCVLITRECSHTKAVRVCFSTFVLVFFLPPYCCSVW